jgi:hypothetical protein
MDILFCDNPLDKTRVDPDYEDEFIAASKNGFKTHIFSFEALTTDNDAFGSIKKIRPGDAVKTILYRGWMLKPTQYKLLYEALISKSYRLINSPVEYQNCHYFPDSYQFIRASTPESVWITLDSPNVDYTKVFELIEPLGDSALLVKDFVKSQKHHWDTACFIPSAKDKQRVQSIIQNFLQLQGKDLNEGLVFRKYIPLQDLAIHSKSQMPLKEEYRLFFINKKLLGCYDYWEEGEYLNEDLPPVATFEDMAEKVDSNFFTMDIAKTQSGEWLIIELGDGQVAGLPDKASRDMFYDKMKSLIDD